jgi:hypothetical protein
LTPAERPHDPESSLSTRVVETTEGLYLLRPHWVSVFKDGGSWNPFARWEWTYNWWLAFGRGSGRVRDHLQVLVHADADGVTRGITPLVRTEMGFGRARIPKLRSAGAVPGGYLTEMYPHIWARGDETSERTRGVPLPRA